MTEAGRPVGMRSLAVTFPKVLRTNAFWREKYPEVVATAEERALGAVWSAPEQDGGALPVFLQEMSRYIDDPFRGTVERRVLASDESGIDLELRVARQALAAAELTVEEIDLVISCSFPSHNIGVGNATIIAGELGVDGAAWNLETACSSALLALRTACGLVRAGEHQRVLVVGSCTYSRVAAESSTLSWPMGDAATAFVVSELAEEGGWLGGYSMHTADTFELLRYDVEHDASGLAQLRIQASPGIKDILRQSAERTSKECCSRALAKANLTLEQIDLFVCNTSTAWFAAFFAKHFGVDADRVVNTFPSYANIGPILWPANLFHAAKSGRIKRGDNVLLFSLGGASSACGAVLRWTDVALGPPVDPPTATL